MLEKERPNALEMAAKEDEEGQEEEKDSGDVSIFFSRAFDWCLRFLNSEL